MIRCTTVEISSGTQQPASGAQSSPDIPRSLVILRAVPIMTYDSLFVVLILPLSIGCGSIVNDEDVSYVKVQFVVKRTQLLANGVG